MNYPECVVVARGQSYTFDVEVSSILHIYGNYYTIFEGTNDLSVVKLKISLSPQRPKLA